MTPTWTVEYIDGGKYVLHPAVVPNDDTAILLAAGTAHGMSTTTGVGEPIPVVALWTPGGVEVPIFTPAARLLARHLVEAADLADRAAGIDPEETNPDG